MTVPIPAAARFDAARTLAFGSVGAAFTNIGNALESVTRILKIVNTMDVDIEVSYDGGVSVNDFVPSGGFVLYDEATNGLSFSIRTQIAVRRTAVPSSGAVYVIAAHARGE